jgi:hypothetical protein
MKLTSTAFSDKQSIPAVYTCDGKDINPPLEIGDVPDSAKSLALIVDDHDAPAGDWVHWLVWNIAPETKAISENSTPAGAPAVTGAPAVLGRPTTVTAAPAAPAIFGTTDFGRTGWGGPCPPSGTHRYQFKLYAIDTILNIPPTTKKAGLESAMKGHIIEQTTLVGLYRR